ncbi:MAG: hypothetical protein ACR2K1_15660 [Saprospiraceae bacterium]
MKEYYLLLLAATFALPGCIIQRKIADDMKAHQGQIDSILAEFERTKDPAVFREIPAELLRLPLVFTFPDTILDFAGDTSLFEVDLNHIPDAGKEIDTGAQRVTIRRVINEAGQPVFMVQAVTKPKQVRVFLPENPKPAQKHNSSILYMLLLIIGVITAYLKNRK